MRLGLEYNLLSFPLIFYLFINFIHHDGCMEDIISMSVRMSVVVGLLVYAGTPLARISHRQLIDKLYEFLTAFLQLRYELSVLSMRSL